MTPKEIDERINRLSKGKCMFMQKIFKQVGAELNQKAPVQVGELANIFKTIITMSKGHNEAMDFLTDKGLTLPERMMVRNAFKDHYKDDHPNITPQYADGLSVWILKNDKVNMTFLKLETALLAQAIYEAQKSDFEINKFNQDLKYILKLLGIDSPYAT